MLFSRIIFENEDKTFIQICSKFISKFILRFVPLSYCIYLSIKNAQERKNISSFPSSCYDNTMTLNQHNGNHKKTFY